MRTLLIAISLVVTTLYSCNGKPRQNANDNNNTPAPLQETKNPGYSLSKRGPSDLVNDLYDDLKNTIPVLQELEKNIDNVDRQKQDSAEAFEEYDQKNQRYYASANQHMGSIQDSLLKLRVSTLISNSMNVYQNRTQAHQQLLAMLQTKNIRLSDLHTVLKLVRTLAIIDKYQKDHLPSISPLQDVSKEYDKLISETDQLSK